MTTATLAPATRPGSSVLRRTVRFELAKLLSQWRIRLLVVACWIVPGLFVAVVSRQASLPTDTVFGRWMHATGWAGSLVVLGFASTWLLPLLTSLVAGDVFASEDRLGTWRHLLLAVRSRRAIFRAKASAALTIVLLLVVGLAVSGSTGGLLSAGNRSLVGLDGSSLSPTHAATTALLCWASVLAPTLAFAAVGLLGSVLLGRSPMALLVPALLALAMQLVQLLPIPVALRMALPDQGFLAWRGLVSGSPQWGPVVIGIVVSLAWAAAATALAHWAFHRRDFTNPTADTTGLRAVLVGVLPLGALLLATTAALGAAAPTPGTGIDATQLERSVGAAYSHLYVLQTRELRRPAVTEGQLHTSVTCDKGGARVVDSGPGNDWRCVVGWTLPGATTTAHAIYQLDVHADGRYVADGDGPKEVNGFFQVRTPYGDAPNPLWQLDGLVDLLDTQQEGTT